MKLGIFSHLCFLNVKLFHFRNQPKPQHIYVEWSIWNVHYNSAKIEKISKKIDCGTCQKLSITLLYTIITIKYNYCINLFNIFEKIKNIGIVNNGFLIQKIMQDKIIEIKNKISEDIEILRRAL